MADAIRFDRSLYEPAAVEAAVEAWQDCARFSVEQHEDHVLVRISPSVGDPEEARDAFCNHVLHETILRARATGEGR